MGSIVLTSRIDGLGLRLEKSMTRTATGGDVRSTYFPMGHAGVLTTRTDNNTGVITMNAGGHGITSGMRVAIRWSSGIQTHVTVGAVGGNTIPIDLGVGNNLPIATTAVVVSQEYVTDLTFHSNGLVLLAGQLDWEDPGTEVTVPVQFFASDGTTIVASASFVDDDVLVYDVSAGITNPFDLEADDPTTFVGSNPSTTSDVTLNLAVLVESLE